MFAALLTTLTFAVSGVCSGRLGGSLGAIHANGLRSILAIAVLSAYACFLGQGLAGSGMTLLVLSGVIGFGVGDTAFFQGLQRLGPRLAILLCQCLAVPIAALTEWAWLGTTLTIPQLVLAAVILVGVALALAPSDHLHLPKGALRAGVIFGVISALGQSWGAVLSRRAYELNAMQGTSVDALTVTFQRMIGGIAWILPIYLIYLIHQRLYHRSQLLRLAKLRQSWPWLVGSGLAGPVIGVALYQWALATTASAVVLAIVATTPIVIMPLTYWIDRDRPSRRAVLGAIIAVAGVIGLLIFGTSR